MSRLAALAAFALSAGSGAAQVPARLKLDADRLQFDRVRFDGPIATEDSNRDEFHAYCDVLAHARSFPAGELAQGGERFVTLRDLLDKKSGRSWQFELLSLKLNLKNCRPFPAPKPLAERGVPTLYECWLFAPPADDAVCVVVSELPPGVRPSLDYGYAEPVTVAGYFFKLLQYQSRERDPARPGEFLTRRAPLLLGRSFEAVPQAAAADPLAGPLVPAVAGALALLAAAAAGAVWYARSGDRAARAQLAAWRGRNPFAPSPVDSPPPSDP